MEPNKTEVIESGNGNGNHLPILRSENPTKHGDYIANTFPTAETDRRMTAGTRQQAPKNLRALHHEIIRLTLLGWKGTEVAKYLQITTVTVSNCLSSYKAKNILRLLTQKRSEAIVDLQKVMVGNAPVVHDVLLNGILSEDTPITVRMKEAREYLGICGYVKPQRIQAQTVHTHLTLEEINEIKAKARQRAEAAGLLSDEDFDNGNGSMEPGSCSDLIDLEMVGQERVARCNSSSEPD